MEDGPGGSRLSKNNSTNIYSNTLQLGYVATTDNARGGIQLFETPVRSKHPVLIFEEQLLFPPSPTVQWVPAIQKAEISGEA